MFDFWWKPSCHCKRNRDFWWVTFKIYVEMKILAWSTCVCQKNGQHHSKLQGPPSAILSLFWLMFTRDSWIIGPPKTNMTLENPPFSIGNTSSFMVDFPASHVRFFFLGGGGGNPYNLLLYVFQCFFYFGPPAIETSSCVLTSRVLTQILFDPLKSWNYQNIISPIPLDQPKPMKKCRFLGPKYSLNIWIISPKNEGNVGSHGMIPMEWCLEGIYRKSLSHL